MLLQTLCSAAVIHPPRWLVDNMAYLTVMGSQSYGVSGDASDVAIYGFCIPPKDMVFPHLAGEIAGFGTPGPRFEQWQQHHVRPPDGRDSSGVSHAWTLPVAVTDSAGERTRANDSPTRPASPKTDWDGLNPGCSGYSHTSSMIPCSAARAAWTRLVLW